MMRSVSSTIQGLYIGTSGWSYKHWQGVFYPAELKPAEYLEYYVRHFISVELNSSFYHLPRTSTVEGWLKRTPENFRFSLKLSRLITHQKKLRNCEEALGRFFEVVEGMLARTGMILIQLPPGLSYDAVLVADFIAQLQPFAENYRFAMEIRHPSWITAEFFEMLADRGIAFVIADSGQRFPSHEAVTSDTVYLRFHGPGKLYASAYTESDLQKMAEKITDWLDAGRDVWAFFNNDFKGYAVENAIRLEELVRGMD